MHPKENHAEILSNPNIGLRSDGMLVSIPALLKMCNCECLGCAGYEPDITAASLSEVLKLI